LFNLQQQTVDVAMSPILTGDLFVVVGTIDGRSAPNVTAPGRRRRDDTNNP
jgi:hypothetical protein